MAKTVGTRLEQELLRSPEPSIRWRTLVRVQGVKRTSPRVQALEREVRRSPRVAAILSHRAAPYRANTARNVYYKWQGVHWALASLADLGYPRGDADLGELRDRVLSLWLRPLYYREIHLRTARDRQVIQGVPVIQGRARRCASQQGNALLYLSRLQLLDERSADLARLLRRWQWPDGGWNCDRDPAADTSSFMETLTPMVGLRAYAEERGDHDAERAARRAAEVFLTRRMFRRRSDGKVIHPSFLQLHYPLYWHYDVLGGLKGLAALGLLEDPRAQEALDWLESRELPQGGWPADAAYYRVSRQFRSSSEFVTWGEPSSVRRNDWVTTDALYVLTEAGRR